MALPSLQAQNQSSLSSPPNHRARPADVGQIDNTATEEPSSPLHSKHYPINSNPDDSNHLSFDYHDLLRWLWSLQENCIDGCAQMKDIRECYDAYRQFFEGQRMLYDAPNRKLLYIVNEMINVTIFYFSTGHRPEVLDCYDAISAALLDYLSINFKMSFMKRRQWKWAQDNFQYIPHCDKYVFHGQGTHPPPDPYFDNHDKFDSDQYLADAVDRLFDHHSDADESDDVDYSAGYNNNRYDSNKQPDLSFNCDTDHSDDSTHRSHCYPSDNLHGYDSNYGYDLPNQYSDEQHLQQLEQHQPNQQQAAHHLKQPQQLPTNHLNRDNESESYNHDRHQYCDNDRFHSHYNRTTNHSTTTQDVAGLSASTAPKKNNNFTFV